METLTTETLQTIIDILGNVIATTDPVLNMLREEKRSGVVNTSPESIAKIEALLECLKTLEPIWL